MSKQNPRVQKGRIYKQGASWWFRWKTPALVNGRKTWRDQYVRLAPAEQFTSATAVEKAGLIAQYRTQLDTAKKTPSTLQLVNDFVEHVYFPEKEKSKALKASTLCGYRNLFSRHLKSRFAGRVMADFTFRAAQQIVDAIAAERVAAGKGLSSQTLRHLKWFSVSVFDLAKLVGAFPENFENPFRNLKIPHTISVSAPTRYATTDQVLDMIAVLPDTAATVIAVAAFAGLRKSEIQGLKWEDLRDGELHVERAAWRTTTLEPTKTLASNAPVPVLPILARHLEAHRKDSSGSGVVFTGEKLGRPLDLHNLASRTIRPALKAAKIPWPGWHGFRRGLSTNLKTLGVDDTVIQRILRHANVDITQKSYIKIEDKVKSQAMRKLERSLNAKLRARRKKRLS